jgi:hypothetical protein
LYLEVPAATRDDVFEFNIYFELNDRRLNGRNPEYSIVAIKYQNGKCIPWDQFSGAEIDAFVMEYLPMMYQPLSTTHLGRPPSFFQSYLNLPSITMCVFNQHLERITSHRNKKYNADFYRKVALCMPKGVPKEILWEIAVYGFLKPFENVELYHHVF